MQQDKNRRKMDDFKKKKKEMQQKVGWMVLRVRYCEVLSLCSSAF